MCLLTIIFISLCYCYHIESQRYLKKRKIDIDVFLIYFLKGANMNMTADLLPRRIDRPSAWIGEDMTKNSKLWTQTLSSSEIEELESATREFKVMSSNIADISIENFSLPKLGKKLSALRRTLTHGVGFQLIRGLPVKNYTLETAATIFCGIGAHLGMARSQNAMGHILGHVRDTGADPDDTNARIYQTSDRQTFHTDSSDIVGLLCLKTAFEGGKSLLVSTETIYNEMNRVRPDLVPCLFESIATDRRGEIPVGEKPYFEIPVLSWYQGFLTGMYQRQYIDSAQRFPQAMRLTKKHIEALDLFDQLANDKRLHLSMQLDVGDLQFVYNHALLHDRTGFIDWPEPDRKRHLLRLWISAPDDRPLPSCFKERYGSIDIGNRGGIITEHTKLNVPL